MQHNVLTLLVQIHWYSILHYDFQTQPLLRGQQLCCVKALKSVHNTYKGIASEIPNAHLTVYNPFPKCTQVVNGCQIDKKPDTQFMSNDLSTSLKSNQHELRGIPSVTAEILTNSIRWEMVVLAVMMDLAL